MKCELHSVFFQFLFLFMFFLTFSATQIMSAVFLSQDALKIKLFFLLPHHVDLLFVCEFQVDLFCLYPFDKVRSPILLVVFVLSVSWIIYVFLYLLHIYSDECNHIFPSKRLEVQLSIGSILLSEMNNDNNVVISTSDNYYTILKKRKNCFIIIYL